jgi:hypothetical protein
MCGARARRRVPPDEEDVRRHLCMVNGNMCCGIVKDILMARVGADQYEACLELPYVRDS